MADLNDWRNLITRWGTQNHQKGDPKLDALAAINDKQGLVYIDEKIQGGFYYSDFLTRVSTVPETVYRIVKTGAEPLIIEDIVTNVDFSQINNGKFQLSTKLYMMGSNRNTWDYTGGTAVKFGVPLNLLYINKVPAWDLIVSPDTVNLTGTADFVISLRQFYRDSSGNRDTITGVENSFFEAGRKILVPPFSEVLVETVTSGDNGNAAEVASFIHVIEPGEY